MTQLVIQIYAKGVSQGQVKVDAKHSEVRRRSQITVSIGDERLALALAGTIEPASANVAVLPTKIELALDKLPAGVTWPSLVASADSEPARAASGAAPPRDAPRARSKWDAIDVEDEGAPDSDVNEFFRKLYADSDPDTRRAMIKSFQESNGTALSTNWSEVGQKQVPTQPPAGMEVRRYE